MPVSALMAHVEAVVAHIVPTTDHKDAAAVYTEVESTCAEVAVDIDAAASHSVPTTICTEVAASHIESETACTEY